MIGDLTPVARLLPLFCPCLLSSP